MRVPVQTCSLLLLAACSNRIATKGISSDAEATAAAAEVVSALSSLTGRMTKSASGEQYEVTCDSGRAYARMELEAYDFVIEKCTLGGASLDGRVKLELDVTQNDLVRSGTLTLDGAVNYQGSAYAGSFEFNATRVSFDLGGETPKVLPSGSFSVGGVVHHFDHETFAASFTSVPPPVPLGAPKLDVRAGDPRAGLESRASCPSLPAGAVSAELVFEGAGVPCPLTVAGTASDLLVSGVCPFPSGDRTKVSLQWYTTGPASGRHVLLAETVATLPGSLSSAAETAQINFDSPEAFLVPKTEANVNETSTEKDRFNCDRSGTNVCDVASPPQQATVSDQDLCSNLEELCAGTLFSEHLSQCSTAAP